MIESVNWTLKGQLDLERHGGRTPDGIIARILARILALTAAIWHRQDRPRRQKVADRLRLSLNATRPPGIIRLGSLRTPAPSEAAYELTIVLDGTVTGNEMRVAFTFNLSNSGIGFGKLVGAAGYRQLSSAERRLALDAGAAPAAQRDEYEHLTWVLRRFSSAENRRVLRSKGEPTSFNAWRIEILERDGPVAYLVRAPSRRADRGAWYAHRPQRSTRKAGTAIRAGDSRDLVSSP